MIFNPSRVNFAHVHIHKILKRHCSVKLITSKLKKITNSSANNTSNISKIVLLKENQTASVEVNKHKITIFNLHDAQ